jgi:hypothetical protein
VWAGVDIAEYEDPSEGAPTRELGRDRSEGEYIRTNSLVLLVSVSGRWERMV